MIDLKDLQPGDRITVAGKFVRIQNGDEARVLLDMAGSSYSVAPSAVVSFEREWKQGDIAYAKLWGRGEVLKVRGSCAVVLWDEPSHLIDASYPTQYLSRAPWPAK